MRVAIVGLDDPGFVSALQERGAEVLAAPAAHLDMVFLMVRERGELERLTELRPLIYPRGAIWVLRVKGAEAAVRDVQVIEAGQRHLLIDNKIASFSETLAAMRLVIPVAMRGR
ncbi:MAG: hypothetical protein J2P45_30860 [Candidatus Dormibacteraeota bacterium]|nr:hypothetical protein [Candidatus Dormibacteraeota bacterium]